MKISAIIQTAKNKQNQALFYDSQNTRKISLRTPLAWSFEQKSEFFINY